MLLSTQVLDFKLEYAILVEIFPAERKDFLEKRLNDVEFSRIHYLSNGKSIQGYIARPKKTQGKTAVIIYNKGGNNNREPYKDIGGPTLFWVMGFLAQAGFTIIASNYSGGQGSEGIDEFGGQDLDDVINLYPIIQSLEYADENKIGMLGYSRGGMMTYLCMKKQLSWLKTAVTIGGLANLLDSVTRRKEMFTDVYVPCFGGGESEMIERSAAYWADTFDKTFPFLICHGNDDNKVDVSVSIDLLQKSINNGCTVRGYFFEHGDHPLWTHQKELLSLLEKWYKNYLL